MAEWQRTHTCEQLREEHIGQTVTLNGWVLITRNYPNQIFVDLRDRYGLTQVVFEADAAELFQQAGELNREWVVSVTGVVRKRLPGAARPDIPTGEVELVAKALLVLNPCPPLKFSVYRVSQRRSQRTKTCASSTVTSTFAAARCNASWGCAIGSAR